LFKKYVSELKLSDYDAGVLTDQKAIALYFEELIKHTKNTKAAANWIMSSIKGYLNQNALEIEEFSVSPKQISALISLVDDGKVSHSVASQNIFPILVEHPEKDPLKIAEENNLIQESDSSAIEEIVREVLAKYPDKVAEYHSGKKGLVGLFMGEVMKLSKGKADPKSANKIVQKILEEHA